MTLETQAPFDPDIERDETYSTVRVEDLEGNQIELFYEPVPAASAGEGLLPEAP